MFNAMFFLVVAFCISCLIMSHKIKDGVVIKFGLILVAIGFVGASSAVLENPENYLPSLRLIGIGASVCIIGVVIRGLCTGGKCRRFSDWFEHESTTRP